ncbi:hypothetical protein P4S72_29930 [Vibrio sp. PP-XX7]
MAAKQDDFENTEFGLAAVSMGQKFIQCRAQDRCKWYGVLVVSAQGDDRVSFSWGYRTTEK